MCAGVKTHLAGARLLFQLRKPENKTDVLAALWEARQSAISSQNYELAAALRDLEWDINGGPTP